ncbi:MAG TPA: metalloregulator ArsR/SmtB family transcription factor [Ktedonobacterales bacterium]|nr:metalloregulator ArsR/SmtB family transcription factor [Ktedonobacterales bacterium]
MFRYDGLWGQARVAEHVRSEAAAAEPSHAQVVDEVAVTRARAALAGAVAYTRVARLFGALADPTRARLVDTLLQEELCTGDLAVVLGITESGVSQHLRVLRRLQIVKSRRAGKFVYHCLDDEHVAQLMALGLTHASHAGATRATPTTPATRTNDAPPRADRARNAE